MSGTLPSLVTETDKYAGSRQAVIANTADKLTCPPKVLVGRPTSHDVAGGDLYESPGWYPRILMKLLNKNGAE